MICHYWLFNHGFKFQGYVCNGCHDLTMLSVNISNIAIIAVKSVDYRCIIHSISKSEAIDSLKNSDLEKYFKSIQGDFLNIFCLVLYKMVGGMCIYKSLNINTQTVMKNPENAKISSWSYRFWPSI